jgi:hypothetical protein
MKRTNRFLLVLGLLAAALLPSSPQDLRAQSGSNRTLYRLLPDLPVVDVRSSGATPGDGTDDSAAIQNATNAAAAANGKGVVQFPAGTYKVSANLTIPSNVTAAFSTGAQLSIDAGKTVTFNGPVEAGPHRIFSGSGTATFGAGVFRRLDAEWWGGGAGGQTAAINAAIAGGDAVIYGSVDYPVLIFRGGLLVYQFSKDGFAAQSGHNTPGTHVLQNAVDVGLIAPGITLGHWAAKGPNSLNNYHTYAYALVLASDTTAASMKSTYRVGVMNNVADPNNGSFLQPNVFYDFTGASFTIPTGSTIEGANGNLLTLSNFITRGLVIQQAPNSALADVNFVNGAMSAWTDESVGSLKFKLKDSTGTFRTAVVPFARPRFDVTEYGAKVDGTTDDSTAVNAAGTAASSVGGEVYFPPGTCVAENVTLYSGVRYNGVLGASVLKLKGSAASGFLMRGQNASTLMGTTNTGGIVNTVVENLILDGNKANNTAGVGIQLYGYGYTFRNLIVRNFDGHGIESDWNGSQGFGQDGPEAQFDNVKVHDCDGMGVRFAGPHDSKFANCVFFRNNLNLYLGPNAVACQFKNFHSWSPTTQGVVVEGGYSQWSNAAAEGAGGDRANFVMLGGGGTMTGCHFYGTDGSGSENATGLQLGQTGDSTYGSGAGAVTVTGAKQSTGLNITASFDHCGGTGGALNFVNEANNTIAARFFQNQGTYTGGTPSNSTTYALEVNGLTADGTLALSGGRKLGSKSNQALVLTDKAGSDKFNVNTNSSKVEVPNNAKLYLYSSGYSSNTAIGLNGDGSQGIGWNNSAGTFDAFISRAAGGVVKSNGTFADSGVSNAGAIASSATIAVTSGGNAVGTIRCQPAGAVTGEILAVGSTNGQRVTVFNESAAANTITFAASGTSNVADGTGDVVAGLTSRTFVWNASTSLWYPAK